jgi:hypothetical protein
LLAGAAGVAAAPPVAGLAELAVPELAVPLVLLWLWRFTFLLESVWLVESELFPVAGAAVLGAVCAIKLIADKVKIELTIRVFIFVLLLFCFE